MLQFCKDFPDGDDQVMKHGYEKAPIAVKLRILKVIWPWLVWYLKTGVSLYSILQTALSLMLEAWYLSLQCAFMLE